MSFLDNQSLDIPCPNCERTFKRTVAALQRQGNTCPYCRQRFDTSSLRRGIQTADRAMNDLKRTVNQTIKINLKF